MKMKIFTLKLIFGLIDMLTLLWELIEKKMYCFCIVTELDLCLITSSLN